MEPAVDLIRRIGKGPIRKSVAAPSPSGDPLTFVMSDGSVDRMGDVIEPDGWDLEAFYKNPVALWAHNSRFIVGNWRDVSIQKGQMVGTLDLMEAVTPELLHIVTAVKAGMLRAVSVGFHPKKYEPLPDSEVGGYRFLEQELVECSLVTVPANANALRKAAELGIPREAQRLIFGEPADGDRPLLLRRGLHGEPAGKDLILRSKPMLLSEKIEVAQSELVSLGEQFVSVMEGDDKTKQRELTERIEEVKENLTLLVRAERALGNDSQAVEVPAGRTTVFPPGGGLPATRSQPSKPTWAHPKRKEEEPGYLWIRHCVCMAIAHVTRRSPAEVMTERYGQYGDFEQTKGVHDWFIRAATAPATTTTVGWAAELAQTQYGEYFAALLPGGIYGPLSSRGFRATLGRYAQISMPTRQLSPQVAGSFVAEGAPIPVRQAAFVAVTLGLKKMAVIVSYTREIAEHSTPQAEQIIRELIQEDTSIAVDTILIDANPASGIRPPGLRNGVSVTAATAGGGFNALVGDIKALIGVLAAANSLRVPVWIMNPVQAVAISLTQNAGGDFPFKAEINGQTLQGYPVIVSSTVPAGMLILLDAADFMSVTGDDPRFDVSDQATLHFEDTTPLQIGTAGTPPVVAAPVRSMFQTDSLALRMILPMNWGMRRTGVIAWTQAVTW
jgi:HK97 family phage prohead protease